VVETIYSERIRQSYGDVDLVVGCGDLPYYYGEYVVSMLDKPTLYVKGNHDVGMQHTFDGRRLTGAEGADLIEDRMVRVNGLLFLGLGGSMRYKPGVAQQYTEGEMRARLWGLLPALLFNRLRYGRFVDVVVTHSPPYHIHDRTDLPHTGFKTFLGLMRRFKPRYLLHGHAHIWRNNEVSETLYESTTVLNVYPVRVLEIAPLEGVR
jgi:Icc-related predicted phosphoesterase